MKRQLLSVTVVVGLFATSALAQLTVPGADGSDGPLTVAANQTLTINLASAPTGTWNGANTSPGNGVYDASKWAVVFRYSSVTINSGATVRFTNHPSHAPVVWLVNGNVTINGTLMLDGAAGTRGDNPVVSFAEPGPGGFRGGRRAAYPANDPAAGMGPGGANLSGSSNQNSAGPGGSYATLGGSNTGCISGTNSPTYGNSTGLLLIGGSGGTAGRRFNDNSSGGGAGGGAILIAATGDLSLTGTSIAPASILARGGDGGLWGSCYGGGAGGAGGLIRLVANRIIGNQYVTISALGGGSDGGVANGGDGRVRLEASSAANVQLQTATTPVSTGAVAGSPVQIWPGAGTPTVRVATLDNASVPTDPAASFGIADVNRTNPNALVATLECTNVPVPGAAGSPPPTGVSFRLRVVPESGTPQIYDNTTGSIVFVGGNASLSTWQVSNIYLAHGVHVIQARVTIP